MCVCGGVDLRLLFREGGGCLLFQKGKSFVEGRNLCHLLFFMLYHSDLPSKPIDPTFKCEEQSSEFG